MIGETLSHYQIVDKIGEGGMGEVYRARDPRLGRDVAIKILPSAFAQRTDRLTRFQQEARAAGTLNHPNILAIHDVGNDRGMNFLVSELLEGEALRTRINSGSLTQRKAVEYAAQIADGLAAAHGHNIIHRDLKPENIFITRGGHVKILDFGLAKLTERDPDSPTSTESATEAMTDSKMVVGTPGYMSPEQLRGEPEDHRSDIFSFGILLYEMIAWRYPFEGDTAAEVSAAILRDEPLPLSDINRPVPPTLDRMIRQCLEKSPDDRFESAHDLAHMLRAVSETDETPVAFLKERKTRRWLLPTAIAAGIVIAAVVGWEILQLALTPDLPAVQHIVVLPFEAAGEDPESGFMAAGLAATLADGLTIVERETRGATWVIPPSPGLTLEDARKKHNATIGVRGVLDPDAKRVHLNLELVDPANGRTLDRRILDESLRNLEGLQKEPVSMVWEMLGFEPTPEVLEELNECSTNTVTACHSYVSGRGRLSTADSEEELLAAAAALEQAVNEDAGYGPAQVALARAFARLFEVTGEEEWKERAIAEVRRSIELYGESPEPYLVLGNVYAAAKDSDRKLEALRRAAAVSETANAYLVLGNAATEAGLFEEAETALQTAINLRPDHFDPHHSLGYLYVQMGRYDAAANEFRYAARAAPANETGHLNLGAILYLQGFRNEARKVFEYAIGAGPPNTVAYSNLGALYFEEGRFGDAADMFELAGELLGEDISPNQYPIVANQAGAQYWGGERQQAQSTFERAIELAEAHLVQEPGNSSIMADLAGYYGMVGKHDRGFELLEIAMRHDIRDAYVLGVIGESFEDLGDRDRAIEWIGTALETGLDLDWIERRPSLNNLREDERYKELVEEPSNRG